MDELALVAGRDFSAKTCDDTAEEYTKLIQRPMRAKPDVTARAGRFGPWILLLEPQFLLTYCCIHD
jgi:hypothetical protein